MRVCTLLSAEKERSAVAGLIWDGHSNGLNLTKCKYELTKLYSWSQRTGRASVKDGTFRCVWVSLSLSSPLSLRSPSEPSCENCSFQFAFKCADELFNFARSFRGFDQTTISKSVEDNKEEGDDSDDDELSSTSVCSVTVITIILFFFVGFIGRGDRCVVKFLERSSEIK